jgi:glucoamylase
MNNKCRSLDAGRRLRVELPSPALVHWTTDAWASAKDTPTYDSGFGVYTVDLPTQALLPGGSGIHDLLARSDHWEGRNFSVLIASR